MALAALLEACRDRTERALERWLPAAGSEPESLHAAMRYAVLDGGKRVRPALVYLAGRATGAADAALDGPAVAVELIHAYSLVHDDLPAMDDDALRRGKPTCHRAFDEATAILTGDALQSLAFQVLAEDPAMTAAPGARLEMVRTLAEAAGAAGMVGGQALDMAATGRAPDLAGLQAIHARKTGALIRASVRLGALAGPEATDPRLAALDRYAQKLGLAFQVQDDVLDVIGDAEALGKARGADAARDKSTYPALLGLEPARAEVRTLSGEAAAHLEPFGVEAKPLRQLAALLADRVA